MGFVIKPVWSRLVLLSWLCLWLIGAPAQTRQQERRPPASDEQETLKLDTSLVTVPVVVSNQSDVYLSDLHQEDFAVLEDGVKQEVVFFAAIKEPFNVVLMLDTSGSTREKLRQIQRAAIAFTAELQPADRVKVISFDDEVRDLGDFTGDRSVLRRAIEGTQPGKGTKLYDAVRLALNNLARVKGRKAIVIFTDGVDFRSDSTTYDANIKDLEEAGVIVYPIRYDTREDTERLVREQQRSGSGDLGTVLGGRPRGTTPTTIPGGAPIPTGSDDGRSGRINLPSPPILSPRPNDRYPDRYPDRLPDRDRYPDSRQPPGGSRLPDDPLGFPDARYPTGRAPDRRRSDDSISVMLDGLYRTGDAYLRDLAVKSGGELHRADTLVSLPEVFTRIADELRHQYSLGYYPTNQARRGKFRRIQVKVSRPGAVVRARPGYREPSGNLSGTK